MENWLKLSLLLSVFGFLKEFRPSEPFVYEFLIGPWRNITEQQVNEQVYPISTYSYLVLLIVAFFITDLCRYKPLIVIVGLSGITVFAMLIWTTSLFLLQLLEVFYGVFMAFEVAYYTYIYAKVDNDYYQRVTSHTRSAILAGRAVSSLLGQLLISMNWMDYKQLHYISFGALILATLWSLTLPSVKRTIYFHQTQNQRPFTPTKFRNAFVLMRKHLSDFAKNKYILKWAVFWALSTAGFLQVQIYMQPLWTQIGQESDEGDYEVYNGAVEGVATLLGFGAALLGGYLKVDWESKGELILTICAFMQASVTLISSQTEQVLVSYACYIVFCTMYQFLITVASAEIAKGILEDSYGLIFGMTTFIALVIQTFLTICLVTGDLGWNLIPRNQFLAYGIFHIFIAGFFILIGLISWIKSNRDIKKTYN